MKNIIKYLVRPNDYSVFELDESNGCYRSYKGPTYSDGTRPNAQLHFTFENLTENYDFFPITEDEISIYEKKCDQYYKFLSWQTRSDGHGGIKGGTFDEYLNYIKKITIKPTDQEKLFNDIINLQYQIQSLASYVQNDFEKDEELWITKETIQEINDLYDKFINDLNILRKRSIDMMLFYLK